MALIPLFFFALILPVGVLMVAEGASPVLGAFLILIGVLFGAAASALLPD